MRRITLKTIIPMIMAVCVFSPAQPAQGAGAKLHDHVWSNLPVTWSPGNWTVNGKVVYQTFPGGTTTPTPAGDDHDWDWVDCTQKPNDWHWSAWFENPKNQVQWHVHFWFGWGGSIPKIAGKVVCHTTIPAIIIDVNLDGNTYEVFEDLDGGQGNPTPGPTLTGPLVWTDFPGDLLATGDFFEVDATRKNVEEPIPTVSAWGLVVMTVLVLTAATIVLGRRRRPVVA